MMSENQRITDEMVEAALAEYDISLRSDPRNTEQARGRPGVVERMRKDAMREALAAVFEAMPHLEEGQTHLEPASQPTCPPEGIHELLADLRGHVEGDIEASSWSEPEYSLEARGLVKRIDAMTARLKEEMSMDKFTSIPERDGLFWYFENGAAEPQPVLIYQTKWGKNFKSFNGAVQSWLLEGEYLLGPQAAPAAQSGLSPTDEHHKARQ